MKAFELKYILDEDHNPVAIHDMKKWAKWFEDCNRRHVALTEIGNKIISTVFLGLDHNFSEKGPPLLFETMIFCDDDGKWKDYQTRCSTWQEALEMHESAIKKINS